MSWRIRRALYGLSWTGMVGIAALVFATGFYISTLAPLNVQIERGRQELTDLYAQYGRSATRVEPATPRNELDTFYARLQTQENVAEVVRNLHRNARAVGLRGTKFCSVHLRIRYPVGGSNAKSIQRLKKR